MSRRIGVLTTDPDLRITSWDPTLAAMTGIAPEDARGRPLEAVVPDLEARGLLALIREPLITGAPQILAPAIHHFLIPCAPSEASPEFDRMQQRVVVGALRDEEGSVGLAFTIEDVTARLAQERELARRLRASDPSARLRAIAEFSAMEPIDGLGPLGAAMADDDWQVRRAAVRTIAERPGLPLVEALVSALREHHRHFSALSSALELLTITGVDLAAVLIDLMRDPDSALRVQVALALGTQSGHAVVEALVAALDDPDLNVRFHAIESLGRLRAPAALEHLAAIVDTRDFFLAFPALDALARINDPAVVPRLLPLLGDDMLGAQAADAIAQIGDEDAVAPLLAALDRRGAPVPNLVDALAAIQARYADTFGAAEAIEDLVRRSTSAAAAQRMIDAVPQLSGAQLRNVVIVLGWLRGAAVERALTRLLGTSAVHHEATEAVVRFGAPMVDRLIEQLHDEDLDMRSAAVVALGRIGDRRAVAALVPLLDGEPELRVAAAGALSRIGDREAFQPLLTLLGDGSVAVRHAAIGALNSIGHPDMAAAIEQRLADPDPNVRESAAKIAGYFGYASCFGGLLDRCADPEERVRATALEQLGYLDDNGRVLPVLLEALRADTPRCRAAAAQALGYVNGADALAALEAGLRDGDSWVRYVSAIGLGRCADPSLIPALERLAAGDAATHVRVAAIEAIGALGGASAANLMAPFVDDGDRDVANAATRALGVLGGPSAGGPLRHAVRSSDPSRRAAAVEALVTSGGPSSVELLRETAAADGDPEVARAAADGLALLAGQSGESGTGAVEALLELACDRGREDAAMTALAHVPAGAIPTLGTALTSPAVRIRRAAADALGRLSHPASSAYLRAALDDADAMVRQTAVSALSRVGARGLARKFGEMARADDEARVRQAALAAVRRYGVHHDADANE